MGPPQVLPNQLQVSGTTEGPRLDHENGSTLARPGSIPGRPRVEPALLGSTPGVNSSDKKTVYTISFDCVVEGDPLNLPDLPD